MFIHSHWASRACVNCETLCHVVYVRVHEHVVCVCVRVHESVSLYVCVCVW